MRRWVFFILALIMTCVVFASCGNKNDTEIYVISREEGSGTRQAFSQLFGVVDKNGIDAITGRAEKVTSTYTIISTVTGNKNAIGYVSFGSLRGDVKVLDIDGVFPNIENVQSGKYALVRPFNICYREDKLSSVAADFIKFIESKQGQSIIANKGYVPSAENPENYTASGTVGKITVSGSTSVAPTIEKLADEYKNFNTGVEIEVQQSGSGAGIQAAREGICDIGMSSRDLFYGELEFLVSKRIAADGIVIIVNKDNPISSIRGEDVRDIYLGQVRDWQKIKDRGQI